MVSFQCDACQDVVKKPKLDTHSYRCRSSFTCVDCSKTFGAPAEWKAHTSCISEAEKYQKGLYKGKKNKQQNGSSGPRGDRFPKPVNEFTNRSVASESASVQKDEVQNAPSEETAVAATALPSESNSTAPIPEADGAAVAETKKSKREKKRKTKDAEVHDVLVNDAPMNEGPRRKKKTKLDAAENEGKTKTDVTAEEDGVTKDSPPLPPATAPPNSEPAESKKGKKGKDKSAKDADRVQTGAPLQAELPQSSAVRVKKDDGAVSGKKRTRINQGSEVAEKTLSTAGNDAIDEAPVKKRRKHKSRKEREGDSVPSHVKEPDVKRSPPGDINDSGTGSNKKERKRKERKKEKTNL